MTTRASRACLVCSFVQAQAKFINGGCPNCEDFLEMRGSQDTVLDCTSEVFEGIMFLSSNAQDSWVAKWQRLQGYKPGLYAVKVNGIVSLPPAKSLQNDPLMSTKQLPEEYIAAAENAGVKYIP